MFASKRSISKVPLSYVDNFVIHWPQACPAVPGGTKPLLAWNVEHCADKDHEAMLHGDRNCTVFGEISLKSRFPFVYALLLDTEILRPQQAKNSAKVGPHVVPGEHNNNIQCDRKLGST